MGTSTITSRNNPDVAQTAHKEVGMGEMFSSKKNLYKGKLPGLLQVRIRLPVHLAREARRIDRTDRVKKQPTGKGPGKQELKRKQMHQRKNKKKRFQRENTNDAQSLRKFILFGLCSISLE